MLHVEALKKVPGALVFPRRSYFLAARWDQHHTSHAHGIIVQPDHKKGQNLNNLLPNKVISRLANEQLQNLFRACARALRPKFLYYHLVHKLFEEEKDRHQGRTNALPDDIYLF